MREIFSIKSIKQKTKTLLHNAKGASSQRLITIMNVYSSYSAIHILMKYKLQKAKGK
jgi:hypothetical protein